MSQSARDYLFFVLWIGSYIAVYQIVFRSKLRHVRAQNNLLERCRALYLLAVQHLENGDTANSELSLARIRRIETVWKLGDSALLRWSVTLKGIALAVVTGAIMRSLPLPGLSGRETAFQRFADDLFSIVSLFIVLPPLLHALLANALDGWHDLDYIDNSGDRLEQILRAGSAVADVPSGPHSYSLSSHGLTHREVLGVGSNYTLAQLKSARNRMAKKFHPDQWTSASPAELSASGEAMKRVNAAFDALSKSL